MVAIAPHTNLTVDPRRRITDVVMRALAGVAAFIGAGSLLFLLVYVLINGIRSLSWEFFTQMPAPIGTEGGGIAHAIIGSIIIVLLTCVWAIPLGIGAGIYLSDYSHTRWGTIVRFTADVLSGVPSIVFGIFGYTIIVIRTGGFSGAAAAFALGV